MQDSQKPKSKKTNSKQPNLPRKILKISGIVLSLLLGLILIATFLLLTILEPYAERFIKKQVVENTDGLYSLEFNDININLFTGTIHLENIHLKPDSLVFQQQNEKGEGNSTTVEIEARLFNISGIGILDAIFKDQLNARKLTIEQPTIITITDNNIEKINKIESEEEAQLEELFNSISIGEINITEGSLHHFLIQEQQKILIHEIPSMTIIIDDLNINLLQPVNQPIDFQVNDLNIKAEGYRFTSSDQQFDLRADLIKYGLIKEELSGKNIVVKNNPSFTNSDTPPGKPITYIFEIPAIQLSGVDLQEAYKTQSLQVENFLLQNTSLNIIKDPDLPVPAETLDLENFYADISDQLKEIKIEKLQILNGSFNYEVKLEEIYNVHKAENIDVTLHSLQLDSATLFKPDAPFFVNDLQVNLEEYKFQHPYSPYEIKLDQLNLSSKEALILVDSIQVKGDLSRNRELVHLQKAQESIYNFEASQIKITDFNPFQAIETRRLDIGNLAIEKGNFSIIKDLKVNHLTSEGTIEDLYEDISEYISQLSVKELQLDEIYFHQYEAGNVKLPVQQLERASFNITGLLLDSSFVYEKNTLLPVENIKVTAADYTHWFSDYTLRFNNLNYSTENQILFVRAFELTPLQNIREPKPAIGYNHRHTYDLAASQVRVYGLDILEIINEKKLDISHVQLNNPEFLMLLNHNIPKQNKEANQQENNLEFLETIFLKEITIEDGSLAYHEIRDETIRTQNLESISAVFLNLDLDQEKLENTEEVIPLQELKLAAREYRYKSPDNIYELKIEQLQYSSLNQTLDAHTIQINSDKEEHDLIKEKYFEKASRNLVDVSAHKLKITGLDLFRALETGYFEIGQIILTEPEVAILQDHNVPIPEPDPEAEEVGSVPEETLEQISDVLETFKVEEIHLDEGNFILNILDDTITRSQTIEHVSLSIDQLRLVSLEAIEVLEMFDMEDVQVLVRDYQYLLPDSLYFLEVGEIKSSLRNKSLSIDSLQLVPLFNKEEFSNNLEYVQDRFDIVIPEIEMEGIDLRELFNNQNFIIENISVNNSNIDIYRDNRLERDPDRRPKTLQNMLRQFDQLVNVESLIFQGGKFSYSDLPPDRDDPIAIIMDDLNLQIQNITNDSASIKENDQIVINATTEFLGESTLKAEILLHLNHPEDLYSYEGNLESMNFNAFNSLFENLLFIRIRDGHINKVEFSVQATEHLAEGNMNFYYNDLNLKFIDRKNPGNPRFRHRVGSWLVNNFLIKSNNPTNRGKFREGNILVERDYQRSVFNHMGAAMIDGLTSSLMPPLVERIYNFFTGD